MKLLFLTILLCFNISTSWTQTQAPPSAIDHANDVTVQLASLRAVNITWSAPSANNAPIQSYTLMFCARLETGCEDGTFTNVTLTIGSEQLITIGGNRLRYRFPELLIGKQYEVVIRAGNSIGQQTSPAFGNGLRFNSAFPDDGQVINVASVSSTNTIILTWNLPPLALATTNLDVSFNITYFSDSDRLNIIAVEYNASRLEQGVSVDLMEANSPAHTFQIVALYTNPNLLSSQAILTGVRTLANDATLLGPEAVVSSDVSPNDVLTVSWPAPMNTNFLVAYRVSYTTSSAQQTSPVEVPAGMTSTTLPFTPFADFTVDVDAVYAPPPDGTRVAINLLPPTTFRTPERASSPPLNVMAVNESVIKIRLTWEVPTSPNGIITGYRIIGSRTGQASDFGTTIFGVNTSSYLSSMLLPNTKYTFRVAAINGDGDGMYSPDIIVRTNFSVAQPVIASTAVGDSGNPSFMITTGHFSDDLGGVGGFKVVVVRGSRVEPGDIPDSSLAPFGISPFIYYVAYYGDARRLGRFVSTTITIGDNVVTTDGMRTTFTNPPPEVGEDYYVFIRLYSAIDVSLFVDSELTDVLRVESMSGGAPQLVPVIPLLLLIITSLVFNVE